MFEKIIQSILVLSLLLIGKVESTTFVDYIKLYDKSYIDEEISDRYMIFSDNLRIIQQHNSNETNTWKMGINIFTDMTKEEFKNNLCYNKNKKNVSVYNIPKNSDSIYPTTLDWEAKGAVTPVKDQKTCGSCYSFSTTGSLEGAYFKKYNKLLSFSEQQIVDCSDKYGNEGCNGGLMDNSFKYVIDNGICLESDYPYVGKKQSCKKCTIATKINNFVDVAPNNEIELLKAVNIQPISVAIEADQRIFQYYSSGVLTSSCGSNLDHGVLLVGYGTLNGIDYWKVKNSWGKNWGDNGYILLGRNIKHKEGQCGIAVSPSYPVIT